LKHHKFIGGHKKKKKKQKEGNESDYEVKGLTRAWML